MYLSLIEVKPTIYNGRFFSNPYKIHQVLWKAFEADSRNFLFRAEDFDSKSGMWKIYLLSEQKPDFDNIQKDEKLEVLNSKTKEFVPKINNRMKLRFYLRANPTVKTKSKTNPDKKTRYSLLKEEELIKWIHRKGKLHGFEVKGFRLRNKKQYISYKRNGNSKRITHGGIDFEGILEVTDKKEFLKCLKKGIGSAKAFGFGLLTVMPL